MKQSQWTFRSTTAYVLHGDYGVSTNCCNYRMVISQRRLTKTLTGLQNKTKHPTTENKTNYWNRWVTWNSFVMVCYEHGLLWKWSILNGLLWVVRYERVCFEWEPFWSVVMFLWVPIFKLFTVIGFSAKAPSHWRWWWKLHVLQQFCPQN